MGLTMTTLTKKICLNMEIKYNIWHIDGYAGWDDYDGQVIVIYI